MRFARELIDATVTSAREKGWKGFAAPVDNNNADGADNDTTVNPADAQVCASPPTRTHTRARNQRCIVVNQ